MELNVLPRVTGRSSSARLCLPPSESLKPDSPGEIMMIPSAEGGRLEDGLPFLFALSGMFM
jgi:hypothetical protein